MFMIWTFCEFVIYNYMYAYIKLRFIKIIKVNKEKINTLFDTIEYSKIIQNIKNYNLVI